MQQNDSSDASTSLSPIPAANSNLHLLQREVIWFASKTGDGVAMKLSVNRFGLCGCAEKFSNLQVAFCISLLCKKRVPVVRITFTAVPANEVPNPEHGQQATMAQGSPKSAKRQRNPFSNVSLA